MWVFKFINIKGKVDKLDILNDLDFEKMDRLKSKELFYELCEKRLLGD